MPELSKLHHLPGEVERELARFEERPLEIARAFLDCFDSKGTQRFEIPGHVLEAMAKRFALVMSDDHSTNSLDHAFGGRVARQRNAILALERQADVVFDHIVDRQEIKKARKPRAGTPFEQATAKVAEKHRLSEESVRKMYKKSGKT